MHNNPTTQPEIIVCAEKRAYQEDDSKRTVRKKADATQAATGEGRG